MQENKQWVTHPIHSKYEVSSCGEVRNIGTGRILKQAVDRKGYKKVSFTGGGKFKKSVSVHRLILEGFFGISDLHVNHKNLNPADNRLENLEYCTRSENVQHALSNGVRFGARGTSHGSNKYSEAQIAIVRELIKKGMGHTAISRKTGVSRDVVYLVAKNKIWKDLKENPGTI